MSEVKELNSVIGTKGANVEGLNFKLALQSADLDWDVREEQVGGMDSGIVFASKKLLIRTDTEEPIGLVGKDYKPSCPRAFVSSQFEFAEHVNGSVSRVGFLKERSRAFAFIDIADLEVKGGAREVGDPMKAFIYSTDGWDGGTPRKSRLYIERLACLNGQTSRVLSASAWVSHTSTMEERAKTRWGTFTAEVKGQLDLVMEQFNKLAAVEMNKDQMEEFAEKLIAGKSSLSTNRRETLVNLFSRGAGNLGASRWDAYNAVTEYVTHHRNYRSNDNTDVETNRFLGVMETDKLVDQALGMLAG